MSEVGVRKCGTFPVRPTSWFGRDPFDTKPSNATIYSAFDFHGVDWSFEFDSSNQIPIDYGVCTEKN